MTQVTTTTNVRHFTMISVEANIIVIDWILANSRNSKVAMRVGRVYLVMY